MTRRVSGRVRLPQTRARAEENRQFARRLAQQPGVWAPYPWPLGAPKGLKSRIESGESAAFGKGYEVDVVDGVPHVRYIGW